MRIQCIKCGRLFLDLDIILLPIEAGYRGLRLEPYCQECYEKGKIIIKKYNAQPLWKKIIEDFK